MNATNETAAVGGEEVPASSNLKNDTIVLKHSHSVPIKNNRREAMTMNPLLFCNSRSNIYDGMETNLNRDMDGAMVLEGDRGGNYEHSSDYDEQRQCPDSTANKIVADGARNGNATTPTAPKTKRMSIKDKMNSSPLLHLNDSQMWTVDDNKVEEISPLFQSQLQRTHIVINVDDGIDCDDDDDDEDDRDEDRIATFDKVKGPSISPSKVATNICNYLKSISALTLYDDENAIAHAELEDDLRILIRLFRKTKGETTRNASNKSGRPQRQIVVEVSRRNGCSAQYHCTATKILNAARGVGNNCDGDGDNSSEDFANQTTTGPFSSTSTNSTDRRRSSLAKAREVKVPAELRNKFLKQVKIINE